MIYTFNDTHAHAPLPVTVGSHAGGDGGEVTLVGSDGGSATSVEFKFRTAADSNVVVKIVDGAPPKVEIGVYYV